MRWFLRLSLKKCLSPARQFPHRAARTLTPCIVCGSRVGMTAAGVNGEPFHLGNGSKRVLDALFEERSDERINRREIGETSFALRALEVEIRQNFPTSDVAMVLQEVASVTELITHRLIPILIKPGLVNSSPT